MKVGRAKCCNNHKSPPSFPLVGCPKGRSRGEGVCAQAAGSGVGMGIEMMVGRG